MSGLGIFIFLMVLSYVLSKGDVGRRGGVHANRISLLTIYALCLGLYSILGVFIFYSLGHIAAIAFVTLVFTHRLQAGFFIKNGWSKAAYRLGKISLLNSVRDRHSRAFFWAYLAVVNAPSDRQEPLLMELKEKLGLYEKIKPKRIQTGTLLVSCFLQNTGARDIDIAKKLQCFEKSASKRIPKELARYCFRFCLAAELKDAPPSDWLDISERVARRWHKVGIRWSTGWVLAKAAERKGTSSVSQKFVLRLSIGKPRWANMLFAAAQPVEMNKATLEIKPGDIGSLHSGKIEDERILLLQSHVNSEEFGDHWAERAKQLGCFNTESATEAIRQSVVEFAGLASASFRDDSDIAYQEIEQQQRQLDMHLRALKFRPRTKKRYYSYSELDKWLNILLVLNQLLEFEPESKISFYYQIRDECWNWMADLWNSENHSLAYFVCNTLHSFALIAEDTNGLENFEDILKGRCR